MNWEPWTGCTRLSDGCKNCYFYGPNAKRYGENTITKTDKFDLPIRKKANGEYVLKGGYTLATCFSTDFFHEGADSFRIDAWKMIKERQDITFLILTKRIDRFLVSLPEDWNDGYNNVFLGCTVENQAMADYRLPLFLLYPIKRKFIAAAPLLTPIDLSPYLNGIEMVTVGGENGRDTRVCDYDWVLSIREDCIKANVDFWFKTTGTFFKHDGIIEKINPFKQGSRAKELGLNILKSEKIY